MFAGTYFAGAAFAGVVGLGGPPPPIEPIDTTAAITIGGVDVTTRVRMKGVTVHDILNDAPNTASLVVEGAGPAVGQAIRITIDEGRRVLFAGEVQQVAQSFTARPDVVAWAVAAIDDTARANARRPFGTWVDTSATTIAQAIATTFAPTFSAAGIAGGLPPVSIILDGSDTFIAALTRLATAIGGYAKVEDGTVYLFQVDPEAPPDPIDALHPFLFDPPIRATIDSSQLRTRVYGKGYGEAIQSDLAAGETLIPIENGAQFPAPSGQAIAGITADGAQAERLTYTGVERAPGGTLVGPGAAPTTAPGVSLAAGAGVESGDHDYAVVFVTAAGRSLAGPPARITVGQLAAPPTAPSAGAPYAGPGNAMPAGPHRYYAVFRTATGTTLPGPASNAVTPTGTAAPGAHAASVDLGDGGLARGASYYYKSTWYRASDGTETEPGPAVGLYTFEGNWDNGFRTGGVQQLAPPSGFVQRIYRTNDGVDTGGVGVPYYRIMNLRATAGYWIQADSALGGAPPAANTTVKGTCALTNIPVSPSSVVTHVDLYREFNNAGAATARFLTSQPNGTTTFVDGLANASLGGLMPTTNTTTANRVTVTWPAGPPNVTALELYRTPIGSAQLKKFHQTASNAAGTIVDSTPDASLTTNAPTSDTSGLTQPSGQVNPGASAIPVASTAPFRAAGGWVALAGEQVVRYTGITGSTLSGVPVTGPGALTTTVIYGAPAIPAPMLTGVTGVTRPMAKGSAIHIWVQRDDLAAQAEQAARAGGDGVVEYVLVDMRRGAPSLIARCDAELALFARPIVTVTYATRDLKTKSGKLIRVELASPSINQTLTIQDVTITDIDQVPHVAPRFTVTASTVRFSLEDTLRRLVAGGLIVGGSS